MMVNYHIMGTRSQGLQSQGSETMTQVSRIEADPKRPAPYVWGEEIVRSAWKRAAVWQLLEGKYEVLENGCWRWTEGTDSNGYPTVWIPTIFGNIFVPVHRLTWILTNGLIPMEPSGKRSMSVCHSCDYPPCINPAHHFLGTQAQNMQDMAEKGRACWGDKNGSVKVSESVVEEIRTRVAAGERQYVMCDEFSLSPAQVSRIVRGRRRQKDPGQTVKRHGNYKHGKYAKRRDSSDVS